MPSLCRVVVLRALSLLALVLPLSAQAQSADDGADLFQEACSACHGTTAGDNGIGPALVGVVGRKAGSAPGFTYSAAMKASGLVWTDKTLDTYLANPKKDVPGTKMGLAGIPSADNRSALIAYLKTLK
jgi:cytochrome c